MTEHDKSFQMNPDQLHAAAVSHLEAVAAVGIGHAAELAKTRLAEVKNGRRLETIGEYMGAMFTANSH